MKSVEGKRVLITGAARGLGRLFAARAVEEGAAAVVLWDIDEDALLETAEELRAAGGDVSSYMVDVSSPEAITQASQWVLDEVGTIHVLINNAGVVRGNAYFWEVPQADVEQTMAINSLAPMLLAQQFLPGMIASGQECRMVTIASSAGLVSNPRMAVYAASKWAAVGWSDSVRLELEQSGHPQVRVTTVCPTYINTGMFDGAKGIFLTPMLEQEDVVDQTWKHMLKGDPFLIMPWTSRLNKILTGLLPTGIRDFYLEKAGVYHSMDEFTGHDEE